MPFISDLKDRIAAGGKIIIADIAFLTKEDMRKCMEKYKERWDKEESYIVADDIAEQLKIKK